jgi:hypothetical protein
LAFTSIVMFNSVPAASASTSSPGANFSHFILERSSTLATVNTLFDCKHETIIDVQIDDDVIVPALVRGLGQCPECMGEESAVPVSGVAPQTGGKALVLDSIMLIPIGS